MPNNPAKLCDLLRLAMKHEEEAINEYDLMLDCLPLPGEPNYNKPEVVLAYFYLEPIAAQEAKHKELISNLHRVLCE